MCKRGVRKVHGDKLLEEKLGAMTCARVVAVNDSSGAV